MAGPTKAQLMKMAKKFGLTHTRTQGPKNHKPVRIMRGQNGQFISTKPAHERRPKKPKVPRYDKYIRDLSNPNAPPPSASHSQSLSSNLGYGPLKGGGGGSCGSSGCGSLAPL